MTLSFRHLQFQRSIFSIGCDRSVLITFFKAPFISEAVPVIVIILVFIQIFVGSIRIECECIARKPFMAVFGRIHMHIEDVAPDVDMKRIELLLPMEILVIYLERNCSRHVIFDTPVPPVIVLIVFVLVTMEIRQKVLALLNLHLRYRIALTIALRILSIFNPDTAGAAYTAVPAGKDIAVPFFVIVFISFTKFKSKALTDEMGVLSLFRDNRRKKEIEIILTFVAECLDQGFIKPEISFILIQLIFAIGKR